MRRSITVLFAVWFLAISTLLFAFQVHRANAQGVIYIRPGGEIDPSNAPIMKQGNIYTLTGDVRYPEWLGIVVQCNGIVFDGGGYLIRGYETSYEAVKVYHPDYILEYITVRNMDITNFFKGIHFVNCTHCSVQNNLLTGNDKGIELEITDLSIVEDNTLVNNTEAGIQLYFANNNDVSWNNHTDDSGISLSMSSDNEVFQNIMNGMRSGGIGIFASSSNNTIFENTLENKAGAGIGLYSDNNDVHDNFVNGNEYGIYVNAARFNNIFSNRLTGNTISGVYFHFSAVNNTLSENTILGNNRGIGCDSSANNTIARNLVANNNVGINVTYSLNNVVHHNSFIDNTLQTFIDLGASNQIWDYGYPSGGNYWSNYVGVDYYNGPNQDILGSDGVGDTSMIVNGTTKWAPDKDRYPLIMSMIYETEQTHRINVLWNGDAYYVDIESNSTLIQAEFRQSGKTISLDVAGLEGTTGFCNVTIPRVLLEGNLTVLIDATPAVPDPIINFNDSHTFIYFTYSHSTRAITITGTTVVPEFSLCFILPLFTIATLLVTFTSRKKRNMRVQAFEPDRTQKRK